MTAIVTWREDDEREDSRNARNGRWLSRPFKAPASGWLGPRAALRFPWAGMSVPVGVQGSGGPGGARRAVWDGTPLAQLLYPHGGAVGEEFGGAAHEGGGSEAYRHYGVGSEALGLGDHAV